jgi:hypothetical protein
MPKPPPQTIGVNPLDLLVPSAPAAALTGKASARRAADRPQTTVLTVTVPADLADRLEQLILVMPGLDLDTLASEALEQVWTSLHQGGGSARARAAAPPRRGEQGGGARGSAKGAAKGAATAGAAAAEAAAARARASARRKGRDADLNGRKVVVILGE